MWLQMDSGRYYLKNEHHIFDEFEFKNGRVLNNVHVDYGVMGTPKYDEEGNIVNAIMFCHTFEGDYSSLSDIHLLIDENKVLSKEEYFFISITSLGFPESCSPSTTGLKDLFPEYEIEDLINFKRQLIKEKFQNIKRFHGIIGIAFGGYEALGWSVFYPDEMDFVIHFASSFKNDGYKYIYAKLANDIIESSPQYFSEVYDESISKVLISLSQLHYLVTFSMNYFNKMSIDEIDLTMDSFADRGLFYDIYDIKIRNDFLKTYNLENYLDRIKSKALIVSVDNNNYYTPEYDSIPLHNAVENSELIFLDMGDEPNELEHLYKIEEDIKRFLSDV